MCKKGTRRGRIRTIGAWFAGILAAIGAMAGDPAAQAAAAEPTWVLKSETGPAPRYRCAMAYDAARQVTVLFGGRSFDGSLTDYDDTWEWNGQVWTNRQVSGPAARNMHMMAYDAAREKIVLFGGHGDGRLGDTWEWDGQTWTQRTPSASPSPRYYGRMVYDSARQRIALFGGSSSSGLMNDLWEWDGVGNTWNPQTPSTSAPGGRISHGMAYDTVRARTVVFGGERGQSRRWGDAWEWDAQQLTWTQIPGGPEARAGHDMVYDAAREITFMFGGYDASAYIVYGTWEWDGTGWTEPVITGGPSNRRGHAMAYDSARQAIVLFGGTPQQDNSDYPTISSGETWEYGVSDDEPPVISCPADAAVECNASTEPADTGSATATDVCDPNPTVTYQDVESAGSCPQSRIITRTWTATDAAGNVASCTQTITVRDTTPPVLAFTGGQAVGESPVWTLKAETGPSRRDWTAMAYDAKRGVTVLFGGRFFDGSSLIHYDDTWEWDGNAWTEIEVEVAGPSPRSLHAMVYDPVSESVKGRAN